MQSVILRDDAWFGSIPLSLTELKLSSGKKIVDEPIRPRLQLCVRWHFSQRMVLCVCVLRVISVLNYRQHNERWTGKTIKRQNRLVTSVSFYELPLTFSHIAPSILPFTVSLHRAALLKKIRCGICHCGALSVANENVQQRKRERDKVIK